MTSDNDVLLGVPEPADLPAGVSYVVEQDREERLYETAHNAAVMALEQTREQLRAHRKQREDINAEIKLLVAEEELLGRMVRVRRPKP